MIHQCTRTEYWSIPASIRINTVNCVGAMGKGIAREFRRRYQAMYLDYRRVCRTGILHPGEIHTFKHQDIIIVNLATKAHWCGPSQYSWITLGLERLHEFLSRYEPATVTIPALGCGNGGLDWEIVRPMIVDKLNNLDHDLYMCAP